MSEREHFLVGVPAPVAAITDGDNQQLVNQLGVEVFSVLSGTFGDGTMVAQGYANELVEVEEQMRLAQGRDPVEVVSEVDMLLWGQPYDWRKKPEKLIRAAALLCYAARVAKEKS